MSMLPCDIPCSKCGSANVSRRHFAAGENVNQHGRSTRTRSTEYVNRDDRFHQPALADCIMHICRCCGYYWDTAPLEDANATV